MSNTITLKRSSSADSVPAAGVLEYGELAINYNDGNLFYKNADDTVVTIASNKTLTLSGNLTAGNLVTTGTVDTVDLTATGLVDLGQVANVTILGGSDGQLLSTDGAGNLTFIAQSQTFAQYIHVLNRSSTDVSVGLQLPVYMTTREYFVYTRAGDAVGLGTYSS